MAYRYKIGQNVMENGRYGRVFHREIINDVEHYNVWFDGDKPSDPDEMILDDAKCGINVGNLSPQTAVSAAGGTYEPFSENTNARHRDGRKVEISRTSTVVNGKRVYVGSKDGEGWGDFHEDDLI